MKTQNYIFLILFLISFGLHAQQPSHFVIGEDEFSGVDIYDLHQDQNLNYWIATNNGIYLFDGYDIKALECEEMLSNSIFNFAEKENGDIFCHNLTGQIFKINGEDCQLYYTIPDSLMNNSISISIDDEDKLTVFSKKIFTIKKNKTPNLIYSEELGTYSFVFKTNSNALILYDLEKKNLIEIKKGKLSYGYKKLKSKDVQPIFIHLNNKLLAYNRATGQIVDEVSENCEFDLPIIEGEGAHNRYYTDNNNLWIANLSGGIYFYNDSSSFNDKKELIFENRIISAFLVDNEQNKLLATFGKGIIVIPNKKFVDVNLRITNSEVTKITKTKNESAVLGTQSGEVIEIDSNGVIKVLEKKSKKRIEILEYLPKNNKVLFNGVENYLIDDETKLKTEFFSGALKDLTWFDTNSYLVSTNVALYLYNIETKFVKKYGKFTGRNYCVGFDDKNEIVYCGTVGGLIIGTKDSANVFKLFNQNILCTDIEKIDNRIFVATQKNGLLIFEKDILIGILSVKTGLLSNTVKQVKEFNNQIFISTDNGLNILSKNGKVLKTINKVNGLNANNVVDFEIINNTLWVVTNKGVQQILLTDIKNDYFEPNIQIKSIKVNNELIDTNIHSFAHSETKFVFEIASKSLKYKNDIYYEHQLEGIDEKWIKSPYNKHVFDYKSLPPKQYTFKVRSIYKNNKSKTVKYAFTIDKPFWLKSGFYSILIVLFLLSMFTLLSFQIRKQKQKITIENQLNKSQLTALKSQMNPHFIFNSLNSIQDLILKQDRENAYNYISKFALLVRKILNHSDKEFIDFDEEVNILKIYLELEELRFKKDFKFVIKTNETSDIEIPPMLIQPFVENALKHGLLHKKGEKRLLINFYLESDVLFCEIIDNGIGREKSNEIKQRQNKVHSSFSVKSIQTRLDILKELYGENIGINIIDLQNNSENVGTKVVLKIPFNKYF